ncbi:MAG: ABC transporter permease [Caldilineaceae bacterium]
MAVAPMQQTQTALAPQSSIKRRSELQQAWRRFRANRAATVGLFFILVICVVALFAEWILPYDPTYSFPGMRGKPPSVDHLLGFDHIGRDLLSRIIYGARVALLVGLVATTVSLGIGVLVGALAGYFGGWIDSVLSRIVDTLMAFPLLALLIVLSAVMGIELNNNDPGDWRHHLGALCAPFALM